MMGTLYSLVGRNIKVFGRDRMQVFFSFLSVIIVIALYGVFLQKMQIDEIEKVASATSEVVTMVNEWLVAGLLSMIAVTTTLGAYGIAVKDIETKANADFLTAPISRVKLQLSYVIHAFFIGLAFTIIGFIVSEIFIVATGGQLLDLMSLLKVIGILILSVVLASTFNMLLVLFVRSQNAFSTLSTIVGTVLGFLCGVYVPFGVLPGFAQNIIMYFPISHTTVLLREVFMQNSLQDVFQGAPIDMLEAYKLNYGIVYEMNGQVLSSLSSIMIIVGTTIVLTVITMLMYKLKNK